MSTQQIFLFRSRIGNRRFDDVSIRILEAALASTDLRSLSQTRSAMKEFMRSESLRVIREISAKSVDEKLLIIEFLVHVFLLVDDIESCLAMRYEALVMREKEATDKNGLQVSCIEWVSFAEHSLGTGYYSIARKACEKALLCLKMNNCADPGLDGFSQTEHVDEMIKRLKDAATVSGSSRCVQAQAAEYLKNRTVGKKITQHPPAHVQSRCEGSVSFMNGIKRRNMQKFQELKCSGLGFTTRNLANDM